MSSSDEPASSGDEMRSFVIEGIVISGSIDGNVVERSDMVLNHPFAGRAQFHI